MNDPTYDVSESTMLEDTETHWIVGAFYSLIETETVEGHARLTLKPEGPELLQDAFREMEPEEHFDALVALVAMLDFFAFTGSPQLKAEVKEALMPIFDPERTGHLPDESAVNESTRFIAGSETNYEAMLKEDDGSPKQRWWELR